MNGFEILAIILPATLVLSMIVERLIREEEAS